MLTKLAAGLVEATALDWITFALVGPSGEGLLRRLHESVRLRAE